MNKSLSNQAKHILFALLIMSSLSCTGKASTHSHTATSSEIDSIAYYYYYSNILHMIAKTT